MSSHPKHFSRKELPFNQQMKLFWEENGFLIIDDFSLKMNVMKYV